MEVDELRVAKVAGELHSRIATQLQLLASNDSARDSNALLSDIHQFQPVPQLLHNHLGNYVAIILNAYRGKSNTPHITEAFYTLAKIVGPKKVLNFFQTDVHLIPQLTSRFISQQGLHWHEQYLLLCWLTVLVLAPFKLDTFKEENVKDQLRQIGRSQLEHSGPLQPLATRLLGSLIMRSDCHDLFESFIDEVTTQFDTSSDALQQGYLMTINVALHKDPTMKMMDITPMLTKFLLQDSNSGSNVDLLAKILSKLTLYLDKIDDLEGQEDVVMWIEEQFSNKNTDTRFTLARQYSKMLTRIDQCFAVDLMLELLENTEKLSHESFETINSDKLHSYLLSLAELLRLNLIDHAGFDTLVKILHRTFFFQQANITHISGSNIRDASNFIAWSLAKYQKKTLPPQISLPIFTDLLFLCCFDKDIIIRRSSTAAIQELVGRHGGDAWNHIYPNDEQNSARSIRVIEVLDYIDLGSIEKSYMHLPQKLINLFPHLKHQFLEFLIENVYNMDIDLCKLSSRALKTLIINESPETRDQVITQIISKSSKKPSNAFIALSETIPLIHNQSILKEIIPTFNGRKINHHRDTPFIIISYLSLLNVLLDMGVSLLDTVLDNVFDAIRIENLEIRMILKTIAPKLELNEDYWNKWLYYMKNNNLNTAASVAQLPLFRENVNDVMELLISERTDANVKSAIVGSISEYLNSGDILDERALKSLVSKLDDYTVSEQGDVGSKVRFASIRLIDQNIGLFSDALRKEVEGKLLRLAVEPIDRLRQASVKLLLKFYESSEISTETRDLRAYFDEVLQFFRTHYIDSKEVSLELLRGYAFSSGALKATDTLITSSLHSFSSFYIIYLSDQQRKEILLQVASLIKVDPSVSKIDNFESQRHNKQVLVGLQFLTRLLHTNIPIPKDFNLKGLYIRVHNLHLGTKNMTRLSCAIKIFGHMFAAYDLPEAKDRLLWLMINHPLARVRTLASEEVYMVYGEKYEVSKDEKFRDALQTIEQVDWSGKNLKTYANKIDV